MGFLRIDESKCKKDGICASECPVAIIRLKDENSVPAIISGGEEAGVGRVVGGLRRKTNSASQTVRRAHPFSQNTKESVTMSTAIQNSAIKLA